MAQGMTKTVSKSVSDYVGSPYGTIRVSFKMDITETYDVAARTSTLLFHNFRMKAEHSPMGIPAYIRGKVSLQYGGHTVTVLENDPASNVQVYVQSTYQPIKKSGLDYAKTVSGLPHNADGSLSVTVSFDSFYIDSPDTPLYEAKFSSAEDETFALTTLPNQYTLTLSSGAHASGTVKLQASAYRTAGGNLSNGAKIYSGETLRVDFSADAGYEALCTVNGAGVSSGAVKTVSGNMTVAIRAAPLGSAYIQGVLHQPWIYSNGAWALYIPYIYTGGAWVLH